MANDIISTKNVWPNYSPENVAAASKKEHKQTLGKDDFFKILITQLQNQDPTQPLQDREFIAQMAQFTSVEQLMNISKQLGVMQQSLGASSGLIGKVVSWTVPGDPPETKSGVVESIVIKEGVQYAQVGKEQVELDKIEKIENDTGMIDDGGNDNDSDVSEPDNADEEDASDGTGEDAL